MVRIRPTASLLLALLGVAGCTLVDQRTFNPQAGVRPPRPATGPGPAPPLVTVKLGTPSALYAAALNQAVADAVARKPDVAFDVVTVVPAIGTPAQQVAAATAATGEARDIARTINAEGVDDDRIHLLARSEVGATERQVRVFVR